jgi:hypothetical protein
MGHAGAAYGKFKGTREKEESEQEKAAEKAKTAQEKADAKAEAAKEKADAKKKGAQVAKLTSAGGMADLVAKVVLDRTPDSADDIEEFHTLDVEHFNLVYNAIDAAKKRLAKFPIELRKVLKSSSILDASDRTDQMLNLVLGKQPDKGLEAAGDMLLKNLFDEHEVWAVVLTDDNGAEAALGMSHLIMAIINDFKRRNLANVAAKKSKAYPEAIGVVKLISTQRQLIAANLVKLHNAVEQLAEKPVTEAALRRVRKLLERM